MPINYVPPIMAQRMAIVKNAIDAAAPAPGRLVFLDSTANVLAIVPFAVPAFENDDGGVLTMLNGPRTYGAIANGNIATARIEDGAANIVGIGLTVGVTGNVDILVSAMFLTTGNLVTVYSGTITHG